jgi:hypothetical protein
MRDVESLQDMPIEAVAKIPASNFSVVKQLSTQVRNDPRVIQAAQTQTSEQLIETVRAKFPEQHMEKRKVKRFTLEESALVQVEEAIKRAMVRGATNESEALEWICAEAVGSWDAEDTVKEIVARMDDETPEWVQ